MNNLYKYTAKNKSEIKFIERIFCIYFKDYTTIYYSTTDKISRKLKILSIDNIKLYNRINKIINSSSISNIEDVLCLQLSSEISSGIDKCIFSELMKMFNPRKHLTKKLRKFTFTPHKIKTIYNNRKYKKQKKPSIKN